MRLVTFISSDGHDKELKVGAIVGDDVVDLSTDSRIPKDMKSFIDGGSEVMMAAQEILDSGKSRINKSFVKIKAPIYNPEKILCVGMNYVDHCTEQNVPIPVEPLLFSKFASAIVGDGDDIIKVPEYEELDFEVELCVVIGSPCYRVTKENAIQHVFGYTVAHDVSARHWQLKRNGGQWLYGKSGDTMAPIGPTIVTCNEISDVNNLNLKCRVNGITMQDSNTKQLVFRVEEIIAWASRIMTLKAGDLIFTGTPPGVGIFRNPKILLNNGDVVEVEIDGIGKLTNTVVDWK